MTTFTKRRSTGTAARVGLESPTEMKAVDGQLLIDQLIGLGFTVGLNEEEVHDENQSSGKKDGLFAHA
ncbi:MAG TPA: hypothetical protein VFE46_07955 [Pirellulales bacterium]|jgi:hypothetical protein|nr:hypothetical protein [Pirellulales bacterium]